MDCCASNAKEDKMKGGKRKMEVKKSTLLWVAIGVLFVLALFLTFKAGSTSAATTVTQTASVAAKSAASSGMVGGC